MYKCNFLTTTEETGLFVKELDCSNIQMNLDLGAVTINDENLGEILDRFHNVIGHIHISEPELAPVPNEANKPRHAAMSKLLRTFEHKLKVKVASIEMKPPKNGIIGILESIGSVQAIYG